MPADPITFGLTRIAETVRERDRGTPLPPESRSLVEEGLHGDLSGVRVHSGPASQATARLLGTRAFTIGKDVFLGKGVDGQTRDNGRLVLKHELAHTQQQPPWRGEPLDLIPRSSPLEAEADRLSADHPDPVLGAGHPRRVQAPAVMTLHPALWALLAGEAACLFGFFFHGMQRHGRRRDSWLHCWTSCKIATWCPPIPITGQLIAAIVGALKELLDVVLGEAEVRDMINNLHGIACSVQAGTCVDCCDAKEKSGAFASARAGAGETAVASSSGAASGSHDSGLDADDAVDLARRGVPSEERPSQLA